MLSRQLINLTLVPLLAASTSASAQVNMRTMQERQREPEVRHLRIAISQDVAAPRHGLDFIDAPEMRVTSQGLTDSPARRADSTAGWKP